MPSNTVAMSIARANVSTMDTKALREKIMAETGSSKSKANDIVKKIQSEFKKDALACVPLLRRDYYAKRFHLLQVYYHQHLT